MNKNCGRYCADNCVNACTNKTVTYDCTPWNPKQWVKPAIPKGMDPGLYNVLNGCWLCNFYRQEEENEYLCSRSFFDGQVRPPCNQPNFFIPPVNSKDIIAQKKCRKEGQ